MRIMGLDIGTEKIGVAISDELGLTAQGLKTIEVKSKGETFKELDKIIKSFNIEKIVIGLPKNMNGTLGSQAQKILKWIEEFKGHTNLPIETWDERLSTLEASRVLLKADLSRKKRKRVIDKLAAVIILQGYIDRLKNIKYDIEPKI